VYQLCGLHALNALLQAEHGEHFSQRDLDSICVLLDPPRCCHANQHRSAFGLGDYDANVLLYALASRGLDGEWHDARLPASRMELGGVVGLLLNDAEGGGGGGRLARRVFSSGNHWFALRRIGDEWWDLDSSLPRPKRFFDEGEMRNDVARVLGGGGAAILIKELVRTRHYEEEPANSLTARRRKEPPPASPSAAASAAATAAAARAEVPATSLTARQRPSATEAVARADEPATSLTARRRPPACAGEELPTSLTARRRPLAAEAVAMPPRAQSLAPVGAGVARATPAAAPAAAPPPAPAPAAAPRGAQLSRATAASAALRRVVD
jgi:hypothetical protein